MLELEAEFFSDEGRSSQDGNIFEHLFFAIAKARSLYSKDIEGSLELIEDDTCESIPLEVISDDDEISFARCEE